jgi:ATP-dependent RNA helicase DHX37/DHR1
MSATLRVSDFVENKTLFDNPPPIVQIDARQHPVTIHFDRRTRADYVTQTIQKAIKIHSRLPAGGILIFLTGQQEIVGVCKKLDAGFGAKAIHSKKARKSSNMKRPLPPLFPPGNETEDSAPLSKLDRVSERKSKCTALYSYLNAKQGPSRSKTLS